MVDLTKKGFTKTGFVQKYDPVESECSYVQYVNAGQYERALAIITSGYLPDAIVKYPIPEEHLKCAPPRLNEFQAEKIKRSLKLNPEHAMLRWLGNGE